MSLLEKLKDEQARKWDRSKDVALFMKDDYAVFVGRNSEANDALISQHSHPACIWFHIAEGGGSHVVLCVEGKKEPSDDVIYFAAHLAKRFSKSESMKIRYARIEDVFKPEGTAVGVWRSQTISLIEL